MRSGTLSETNVCEHSLLCHPKMQVKALLCKKRNPVMQSSSLSQSSFAMDLAKVENCSVVLNQTIYQNKQKIQQRRSRPLDR